MIHFQPMVAFYWKHQCPACQAVNWTYHSHSQRSEPIWSPEICRCWKCRERYWLMSEEDVELYYEGRTDMALEDDGKEQPR